jgi:mRNA interferase HigB
MPMNVVAMTRLRAFWTVHAPARGPLSAWYTAVSHATWTCFADVKQSYRSADQVGELVVFDVGNYRVVADIAFTTRHVYIKHVFTHPEYDRWSDENRKKR